MRHSSGARVMGPVDGGEGSLERAAWANLMVAGRC
jgi:hypothetical protein